MMLTKLQNFFNQYLSDNTEHTAPLEHRLQLACAVLMVEMTHADEQVDKQEEAKLRQLIKQRFELNSDEIEAIIELAHDEKHGATDYYQYTSLLNTHYSQQQKIKLVEDLWMLAFADGHLDKYEEHLLRRLADLLHVPHQDFIRTKHKTLKDIS
jgi:uncharacterized tellurite resistance protein B-like protein